MGSALRVNTTAWAVGPVLAAIVVFVANPIAPTPIPIQSMLHEAGPPAGHTGGFGEPTCQECHSEFEINPSPGALGVDGFPPRYTPGQRYFISISILGEDTKSAGFQAAIRFLEGAHPTASAGHLETIDDHVVVFKAPENGIDYLQQTRAGSRIVSNGVATWTFLWTAPHDTTTIVLNVAANDANGDNSPLGDFVYAVEVVARGSTSEIEAIENGEPRSANPKSHGNR